MAERVNFNSLEKKVFLEYKGDFYIGGEKVSPEMKALLKEQAKYFATSQLYEILRSTIINESANMALKQSTLDEHVLSAKMLYHWQFVLDNLLVKLSK